jgi:nitrate reductase (cytochrome), electron transfer subunit
MRNSDRTRVTLSRPALLAVACLIAFAVFAAGALAQDIVPRLTGPADPMSNLPAPAISNPVEFEVRPIRAYPEQPPIIPHSIEGYQVSLATNRCLECHRREFTQLVGAPMISFTHYMDRDGQMLADVAPRRYFCTACHVQQSDARALVENTYQDMLLLAPGDGG